MLFAGLEALVVGYYDLVEEIERFSLFIIRVLHNFDAFGIASQ